MSFLKFNFGTMKQKDSVVVLCGGPSTTTNAGRLKSYIKKNSSVVLSANYNFYKTIGIKSDYTYITDQLKLFENISLLDSDLIIPIKMKTSMKNAPKVNRALTRHRGDIRLYIQRRKPFRISSYMIGDKQKVSVYKEKRKQILMKGNGEFPYRRLGSAGQGCILLSLVFRPKKILIVGLDGSTPGDISKKKMFDGSTVKYASEEKHASVIEFLEVMLFPSMLRLGAKYGTRIETYNSVGFYGLNKKKLGVNVIG